MGGGGVLGTGGGFLHFAAERGVLGMAREDTAAHVPHPLLQGEVPLELVDVESIRQYGEDVNGAVAGEVFHQGFLAIVQQAVLHPGNGNGLGAVAEVVVVGVVRSKGLDQLAPRLPQLEELVLVDLQQGIVGVGCFVLLLEFFFLVVGDVHPELVFLFPQRVGQAEGSGVGGRLYFFGELPGLGLFG
jgi:hypothetical protein